MIKVAITDRRHGHRFDIGKECYIERVYIKGEHSGPVYFLAADKDTVGGRFYAIEFDEFRVIEITNKGGIQIFSKDNELGNTVFKSMIDEYIEHNFLNK